MLSIFPSNLYFKGAAGSEGSITLDLIIKLLSFIIILSKFVSKDDSPITMVTYQYTLMTIFAFPLAIYFWQMPSLISILLVFIAAASGTILHLCLGLAYKYADLSVTQPIWFTGLIFGSGFGYFIFNEILLDFNEPNTN